MAVQHHGFPRRKPEWSESVMTVSRHLGTRAARFQASPPADDRTRSAPSDTLVAGVAGSANIAPMLEEDGSHDQSQSRRPHARRRRPRSRQAGRRSSPREEIHHPGRQAARAACSRPA